MALANRITPFPALSPSSGKFFDDNRFRALLPPEQWGRLPLATWRRFSKRLGAGKTIVYVGEIEEASFSRLGWWLAQVTRLIGGPLPRSVWATVISPGVSHFGSASRNGPTCRK